MVSRGPRTYLKRQGFDRRRRGINRWRHPVDWSDRPDALRFKLTDLLARRGDTGKLRSAD